MNLERVKNTALLLLLVAMSISAHSNSRNAMAISQNKEASLSQAPELEEASRLTASVLKLYRDGKYDEAVPLAKRALELREKVLGKDNELSAAAAFNLAELQWRRGKYDESRGLFERALHSYERSLKPEDVGLATVWDRLALVYYSFEKPAETEKLYKKSLAVREQALGPENSEVARSVYNLAEFYQFQGDYKNAEPLYKRLLEIRTKIIADPESIAEAIDRYACLLRKEKRTQEADQLEGRASTALQPAEDSSQWIVGGVVNGKALKLVQPPYPIEARATRASGKVTVLVLINERGNVIRACAIEGPKLLMKASESAAAQSRFSPTTLEGKPVKVSGAIIYNYIAQ